MRTIYKTPGVYVKELSAFPPSVIGVATAVPGFIGYTETATINGKPVLNKAVPIGSLADYEQVFGKGFIPLYAIKEVTDPVVIQAGDYDFNIFDPKDLKVKYYELERSNSKFNLYDSMRLFYGNGGGNCFVVSVGLYVKDDGTVNSVTLSNLETGLKVLKEQVGPTMIVIPDAVNLSGKDAVSDFYDLARKTLAECAELQDRVAILDVYDAEKVKTEAELDVAIKALRDNIYGDDLNYGMVYFPFVHATVFPAKDSTYLNVQTFGGADPFGELKKVLTWQRMDLYGGGDTPTEGRAKAVQDDIDAIGKAPDVVKLNQNLTAALPLLVEIEYDVTRKNNVLPPSAALAGVYTVTDDTRGVWNAPANVSLSAVESATFKLNNTQQEDLNVPVDGKAVNALREFTGRGTVVWGARTLDGNSNDYRYIQVRRTLIYLEQSIKTALNQFVFAANDGNTWSTVVATISSFLQGVWSQGGLMGATASEAFTVQCGVGSTMTGQDILDGYMIVQVTLQMIRPAEFIELSFKQKMEGVA